MDIFDLFDELGRKGTRYVIRPVEGSMPRKPYPILRTNYPYNVFHKYNKDGRLDSVNIQLNIAGIEKDNITISRSGDTLTLTIKAKDNEEKINYVVQSIVNESISSKISIPEGFDIDDISSSYLNGILTITIPVLVQKEPPSTKIEIN